MMKGSILLDTNIIISREDNNEISRELQELLAILNGNEFKVFVHPMSFKDIDRDKNHTRKQIISSKMNSYNILNTHFNFDEDSVFKEKINYKKTPNDIVDNCLLYSLFKDEVTFLITEDNGIHKNARKLNEIKDNFEDRVFTINEALIYFKKEKPILPYEIIKTTVDLLDINDPIFNTLKESYEEFDSWFEKIQREKRECLIFKKTENLLGALLIFKEEEETIVLKDIILPVKNRIKIATMVVTSNGNKIGELFLSWIINYAFKNGVDEVYLTHFSEGQDDSLVYLIKEYGFEYVGNNSREEEVYVKNINSKLIKSKINSNSTESYLGMSKKYYPYFYDGENVEKYIVPIQEEFHKKLFLSENQQTNLEYFMGGGDVIQNISRYVIKKAYLSKANININQGDILLFYESSKQGISEIGVVEHFFKNLSIEDINKKVGKRSVYSQQELETFKDKNSVILFIHSRICKKISLDDLINKNIIKAHPQSIQRLAHEKYLKLKEEMLK